MTTMLQKIMFVIRFIKFKMLYRDRLKTSGFVFFEKNVHFVMQKGSRIKIGKGVYLRKGVILECGPKGVIEIGEKTIISYSVWIGSTNLVKIGDYCLIARLVDIMDVNHATQKDQLIANQGYTQGETIIGADCLIGVKTTVCANVSIGNGTIIGSNSVVCKNLPSNVIATGAPAQIIKART